MHIGKNGRYEVIKSREPATNTLKPGSSCSMLPLSLLELSLVIGHWSNAKDIPFEVRGEE
jgi:hypothetical protein